MDEIQKEIIASFTVRLHDNSQRKIIVSQDIVNNYNGQKLGNNKTLTLETIDGPKVSKTKDPKIFLLADGTVLKKIGYITG